MKAEGRRYPPAFVVQVLVITIIAAVAGVYAQKMIERRLDRGFGSNILGAVFGGAVGGVVTLLSPRKPKSPPAG